MVSVVGLAVVRIGVNDNCIEFFRFRAWAGSVTCLGVEWFEGCKVLGRGGSMLYTVFCVQGVPKQ